MDQYDTELISSLALGAANIATNYVNARDANNRFELEMLHKKQALAAQYGIVLEEGTTLADIYKSITEKSLLAEGIDARSNVSVEDQRYKKFQDLQAEQARSKKIITDQQNYISQWNEEYKNADYRTKGLLIGEALKQPKAIAQTLLGADYDLVLKRASKSSGDSLERSIVTGQFLDMKDPVTAESSTARNKIQQANFESIVGAAMRDNPEWANSLADKKPVELVKEYDKINEYSGGALAKTGKTWKDLGKLPGVGMKSEDIIAGAKEQKTRDANTTINNKIKQDGTISVAEINLIGTQYMLDNTSIASLQKKYASQTSKNEEEAKKQLAYTTAQYNISPVTEPLREIYTMTSGADWNAISNKPVAQINYVLETIPKKLVTEKNDIDEDTKQMFVDNDDELLKLDSGETVLDVYLNSFKDPDVVATEWYNMNHSLGHNSNVTKLVSQLIIKLKNSDNINASRFGRVLKAALDGYTPKRERVVAPYVTFPNSALEAMKDLSKIDSTDQQIKAAIKSQTAANKKSKNTLDLLRNSSVQTVQFVKPD